MTPPRGAFLSAYSPDGSLFATASDSGVVTVWDVALHEPAYEFTLPSTFPTAIAWSSDTMHIGGAHPLALRSRLPYLLPSQSVHPG